MKSNYARARTSFRARSSACRVVWSNSPYILTKRARWLTGRVCRRSAIDGLLRPFGGRFDFHVGPDLSFFLTPFRDRHHLNDRAASIVIELQILSCTEAQAITVAANGQYLAVVAEAIRIAVVTAGSPNTVSILPRCDCWRAASCPVRSVAPPAGRTDGRH